jgi:Ca-activated chloride channel homolog
MKEMLMKFINFKFWFGFYGAVIAFSAFGLPFFTGAQTNVDSRPRQTATKSATPSPTLTPPVLLATPPATVATPNPTPAGGEVVDEGNEGPIRIESDLVNLSVRVVDRNGRVQADVKPQEFKVFEDGVAQKIEFVSVEEVPVNYGMVIDNSGSLRSQLEKVIEAGKILVNANKPEDETFIVRFISSDKITVEQDFTANKNLLNETLDELYVEGGATAVIDAVILAAEKASEYEKSTRAEDRKRRALILVTDGEDRSSYYKEEQLFAKLREADVQIYPIGFVNELEDNKSLFKKGERGKAVALLERLAKESGGKAYFPNSIAELPDIARDITREMRTQYIVSYAPTNDKRDGTFRTIRVQVNDDAKRGKRIAVTRPGYTAKKS